MTRVDRGPLASALRARGIRLTAQRRALLALLEGASGHLTAQSMLDLAREKGVRLDRATVYRTVAVLKEAGLIDELDLLHLTGGEHFYERRSGDFHAHAGCRGCGRIIEVNSSLIPRLAADVHGITGFDVQSVRIEVEGICPECRSGRGGSRQDGPSGH